MKEQFGPDSFARRHIGIDDREMERMLKTLGFESLDTLINAVVPSNIRSTRELLIEERALSEEEAIATLQTMASQNEVWTTFLGTGYYPTTTPAVIQRNVLESPGWYTQYTPYQAEIAQGRLEALLNFQTLISDLTGLPIANASMLDEATAVAEAMAVCLTYNHVSRPTDKGKQKVFLIDRGCHPQTIAVVETRAEPLNIHVLLVDWKEVNNAQTWVGENQCVIGACVQYPTTDGAIFDYRAFGNTVHELGGLLVVSADLMSLVLLESPAAFGADIVVGSAQRFGVPMGFGGPHAAFLAAKDELKRNLPGRIVGVSKDQHGNPAIRLALQTREQHIRREKATSNICTSQVLLAVMAGMYAVYHGPEGLRRIARQIHERACTFADAVRLLGYAVVHQHFFDTVLIDMTRGMDGSAPPLSLQEILDRAANKRFQFRVLNNRYLSLSFDETKTRNHVDSCIQIFLKDGAKPLHASAVKGSSSKLGLLERTAENAMGLLTHSVFNSYHSETEMLRYLHRLQSKDLSLTTSMIPLGSCTMKLNATTEMLPITWPEFSQLHPFTSIEHSKGYQKLFEQLECWLAEITGFDAVSLQPNAGSQGEYAGLLVIRQFHRARGEKHRNICLIPQSAHGTNPASAVMAGMQVVVVACDSWGNIDVADLRSKAEQHHSNLAAAMITYPSTHGVFEETISEICKIVHEHGGQVYMDGANMNAQVGLCRPGDYGPDVAHLNLHKTFCIPHGGGGPGMGPIAVKTHLREFLPGHPLVNVGGTRAVGAVSAAPWGSASILPISWTYIAMMGARGLRRSTEIAILNANYIAKRLDPYFPVLYKGKTGLVAHECIVDLRRFKTTAGVEVEDVAKRLMDYGFHAPTVSFPVAGTMMIEPTESESLNELNRFCDAMILIRQEIDEIEQGKLDRIDNPLKNAPHTAQHATQTEWHHPYSRERAVFPAPWCKTQKFWPAVSRINNVLGDRNLICACQPPSDST